MSKRGKDPRLILFNQAVGPLFRELAEDLAREFGSVTVVTNRKAYPSAGRDHRIVLVNAPRYIRRSETSRLLSWGLYAAKSLAVCLRVRPDTILLLTSNPPCLPMVGWLAARIRRCRYVIVIYDVYPDILIGFGRIREAGLVARLWRYLNRVSFAAASRVITIGELMRSRVATSLPAREGGAIEVIPNWADVKTIAPMPKSENWFARRYSLVDRFSVLYAGNVGETHDLKALLLAAEAARHDDGWKFVIVGDGGGWKRLVEEIVRRRLDNVIALPRQPESSLPFVLAAADVGIVSLRSGMEGLSVPSKMAYLMAAGAALLVIAAPSSEVAETAITAECGVVVDPARPEDAVPMLERLRHNADLLRRYQRNARLAAERSFSRNNTDAYVGVFREILGGHVA